MLFAFHICFWLTEEPLWICQWRHKWASLVAFNLEKLIIVVNSIKRIRAETCLGLTYETTICNDLTAKVSVKCIKWFSICASLKLTDLISLISIFCNVQDHKLVWDTVDTFFNGLFLNYALLKKAGSCYSQGCVINLKTYFIFP